MTTTSRAGTRGRDAVALERVLSFMRSVLAQTADEVRPIDAGWVARSPSLPLVWAMNLLVVPQPLSFDALVALADEQQADLPYRHLSVEHQQTGPVLEDAFRTAGWKVDRELLMILSTGPDREAGTSVVVDADEADVLELMRRWHAENRIIGPQELDQLVEESRRETTVCGDRLLGVKGSDGRLVAITKLRSDGRIAQVEDVYTVPEARGRGYGRALVSRAVALAREAHHELVFIVADDNDWPQLLYGRIGFRPIGRLWLFHRS